MIYCDCDGCYRRIGKDEAVITFEVKTSKGDRFAFHLCDKCETKRRYLHFDNPYYVEPPEDARSEEQSAKGN